VSKRRTPSVEPPEPRRPATAGEIAAAAYGMSLLQAKDDNVDPYEMLALLALECLAMLSGRDPAGFEFLLKGLGIYANMRCTECLHAAMAGQPPSPLSQVILAPIVH
jgi:hypothetical protein